LNLLNQKYNTTMRIFALLILLSIGTNAYDECMSKCVKKQQVREYSKRCLYVVRSFPERKRDRYRPSTRFQDIYIDDQQTTFAKLASEHEKCTSFVVGLFFEGMMYVTMFILLVLTSRRNIL